MSRLFQFFCIALIGTVGHSARAQFLQPLSTFGVSAPGWLAPGNHGFNNDTNATVRGIAYHSPTNRLIVVDRLGGLNVRLLNGDTGVQVGSLISTGVAGGTFIGNMVGVADDGHVYMGNLSTTATTNFKVYRWDSSEVASPSSAPTIAYDALTGRTRTGDSFAVTGSGANTRIVSAGGSAAGDAGFVFASLTTPNGSTFSSSNPGITGAPAGAMRLGITFGGSGNVIGKQTGLATHSGSLSGGPVTNFNLLNPSETAMAYYAPKNLLATIQFGPVPLPGGSNPGDIGVINTVRLYDVTNLTSPVLLDAKNLTNIAINNANGVGALSFGIGPDGLRLYALNANNGIQAFRVVPEPSTGLMALITGVGLFLRRRRS